MRFSDLIKELDSLNLPSDQYAITSSGTLAVRGIREANDIDILPDDKLWEELVKKYEVIKDQICDHIKLSENIEAIGNWHTNDRMFTTEEQITRADVIDGKRYVNLQMIRKFKELLGREKDFHDIELIDEHLNKTKNA